MFRAAKSINNNKYKSSNFNGINIIALTFRHHTVWQNDLILQKLSCILSYKIKAKAMGYSLNYSIL